MIYGGTKYLTELRRVVRILGLLTELKKSNRVCEIPARHVDPVEQEIIDRVDSNAYNDEHLVAIVIVTGCRVVCTRDDGAIELLKRQDLYEGREAKPPKIYQRKRDHEHLCCEDNVVAIPTFN
jgi:hypothetical protein